MQKEQPKQDNVLDIIIQERNEEIRKIHKDMIEINGLFLELGEMVNDQGDDIDRIEDNISRTGDNCKQANKQLEEADELHSRKSNLMLWIGGLSASAAVVTGFIIGAVVLS